MSTTEHKAKCGRGKGKGNTIQETAGVPESEMEIVFQDGWTWERFNKRCVSWLKSRGIHDEFSGAFIQDY